MPFSKPQLLITVFAILLVISNVSCLICNHSLNNTCYEYETCTFSWASVTGSLQAELDYNSKLANRQFQSDQEYETEIEKASWQLYRNVYQRRHSDLNDAIR